MDVADDDELARCSPRFRRWLPSMFFGAAPKRDIANTTIVYSSPLMDGAMLCTCIPSDITTKSSTIYRRIRGGRVDHPAAVGRDVHLEDGEAGLAVEGTIGGRGEDVGELVEMAPALVRGTPGGRYPGKVRLLLALSASAGSCGGPVQLAYGAHGGL